jgi:hypothetical protein
MSNVHVNNVQRMRFNREANGSLAVDGTGTLANFINVPFIEGSANLKLNHNMLSPEHARQQRDEHPTEILGVKDWALSFGINLGPADDRATDGVTMAQTPVGELLEMTMGGENLGTGDAVGDASPAADHFIVAGTPSRFQGGGACGLAISSVLYCRECEELSGTDLKVKLSFPSAPATGADIYNCASYYLDNHDPDNVETGQFIIEALGDSTDFDTWVLMGGQGTTPPTIEFPIGGLPRLTFNFTGCDWDHGDDAAMTPAALADATYAEVNEVLVADGEFRVQTVGTATLAGSEVHGTLEVTPAWKYIPVKSPGGTGTVAAYIMDGEHPKVEGQFTIPYENQSWIDARNGSTKKAITLQIGSSVTDGAVLVTIPAAQLTDVQKVDLDGLMGQTIMYKGQLDTDTTETAATKLGISPIRIHIF